VVRKAVRAFVSADASSATAAGNKTHVPRAAGTREAARRRSWGACARTPWRPWCGAAAALRAGTHTHRAAKRRKREKRCGVPARRRRAAARRLAARTRDRAARRAMAAPDRASRPNAVPRRMLRALSAWLRA
jgi:hypothetical protein